MTKAIKKISKSEKIGPIALKLFLGVFFSLLILYVFFITVTITNAVDNEQKLRKISYQKDHNTEIEKEYINLVGELDMDYARANGFVEKSEKVVYVMRYNSITQR
ncbi:MAG: hypothetical protein AAB890_00270 [Patescibacteria group bacterium]